MYRIYISLDIYHVNYNVKREGNIQFLQTILYNMISLGILPPTYCSPTPIRTIILEKGYGLCDNKLWQDNNGICCVYGAIIKVIINTKKQLFLHTAHICLFNPHQSLHAFLFLPQSFLENLQWCMFLQHYYNIILLSTDFKMSYGECTQYTCSM